ncbi:EAL domain-containing protein [Halobacillus salinarum]|uniref:EAL domain-containing protein n=1 Tax=Halobacillus salinarum TaxID=2932257 RepID=A0ABY4EMK1_9BACI|nr:EAL domain-containing protein [Halobacillus salinarum]UOQ45230.1 EAL domain-containing protein [Halobacillus salinarum]
MEVFVARQPILQLNEEVFGYELLYRSSKENKFTYIDANRATSEVLMNSFTTIGLEKLSQNKPCFVNFTEELLLKQVPEYFDPGQLVVEILEDVSYSRDLVRVCRKLKQLGFLIALDDVVSVRDTDMVELLNYVDIIKVDIQITREIDRQEIIQAANNLGITLLAEKVETREEHQQCVEEGFELFQGYFYSKPVVLSSVDMPFFSSTYFEMIKELSVPTDLINIDKITELFEKDLALTYKLLRLINSSAKNVSIPIQSIRQAVMMLGTDALKKWLYVLSVQSAPNMPKGSQHVMKSSLQRAKMCEQVAIKLGLEHNSEGYFLIGFISLIDVITKKPIHEVTEMLPLDNEIKEALNKKQNSYRYVLDLVIAMERADFEGLEQMLYRKSLSYHELFEIYGQSISWSDHLFSEYFNYGSNQKDEKPK